MPAQPGSGGNEHGHGLRYDESGGSTNTANGHGLDRHESGGWKTVATRGPLNDKRPLANDAEGLMVFP